MYWQYPEYVSVGQKKAKADKMLKKLQKKNKNLLPVQIEGGTLASTWWGKSWNSNLESYADYSNRIGRGRSYVRHGSVLDLQISEGKVSSLVMGSGSRPYSISVTIKKLRKTVWVNIKKLAKDKIHSLQELLQGKFPKALNELFTSKGDGLFPSPKEIDFECSCPDWADMCKHVAATLYGIGARLDDTPEIFFTLRGVNSKELVDYAVNEQKSAIFTKGKTKKSAHIVDADDSKLSSMFDIDFDDKVKTAKPKNSLPKPKKVVKTKKKTVNKKTINKKENLKNPTTRKPVTKKPGTKNEPAKKMVTTKKAATKKVTAKKAQVNKSTKSTTKKSVLKKKKTGTKKTGSE